MDYAIYSIDIYLYYAAFVINGSATYFSLLVKSIPTLLLFNKLS